MDIYTALICRFAGWLILDESSARDRSRRLTVIARHFVFFSFLRFSSLALPLPPSPPFSYLPSRVFFTGEEREDEDGDMKSYLFTLGPVATPNEIEMLPKHIHTHTHIHV